VENFIGLAKLSNVEAIKIIHVCMTLHNFIRDSKMAHELFDKCDEDEEYAHAYYVMSSS
jgi:hypothetical protein